MDGDEFKKAVSDLAAKAADAARQGAISGSASDPENLDGTLMGLGNTLKEMHSIVHRFYDSMNSVIREVNQSTEKWNAAFSAPSEEAVTSAARTGVAMSRSTVMLGAALVGAVALAGYKVNQWISGKNANTNSPVSHRERLLQERVGQEAQHVR